VEVPAGPYLKPEKPDKPDKSETSPKTFAPA
jgi:hypothetical protein